MFELAHPWALALLAIPLVMRLVPAYRESRDSVKVPFFDKLVELSQQRPDTGAMILTRDRAQRFLVGFMWLALVLAAAKPEWVGPPIEQQKSGRDLMVAVDLSGSMEVQDFALPSGATVNRLEAVKRVLQELAAQRASDRLGLIVFGNAAYLQSPFTDDHLIWQQLLQETEIGMAGQSTVFGDAIGLAIKLFMEGGSENRVLIMLTDGNDTGSLIPPERAAEISHDNGVVVHTIAIGDPTSVGEQALDEVTLGNIATTTGGGYFHASDRRELEAIYDHIDEINPREVETQSYRPIIDLYHWPLAAGILISLLYLMFLELRLRYSNRQVLAVETREQVN